MFGPFDDRRGVCPDGKRNRVPAEEFGGECSS